MTRFRIPTDLIDIERIIHIVKNLFNEFRSQDKGVTEYNKYAIELRETIRNLAR